MQHLERRAARLTQQLLPDMRHTGQRLLLRADIGDGAQQDALHMRGHPRHAGKAGIAVPAAREHGLLQRSNLDVADDAAGQLIPAAGEPQQQMAA